jgi:ribosome-associated toxin RatA of RatAB toxin-antitoxin module
MKGLFDKSEQIVIDMQGIRFNKDEFLPWDQIRNTYIETQKKYYNRSTVRYLNIESTFAGQVSGTKVIRSIEVTWMDHSLKSISHYVEYFKKQVKK